jgi:Family of unknown function (DUF6979)
MSAYGRAAVTAVRNLRSGRYNDPGEAWSASVRKIFPASVSLQTKGCPRGAFLGLCEEGLIAGVPPGDYTRSERNKRYALQAVGLIRRQPALVDDPRGLWRRVMAGVQKAENGQMDVVAGLWEAGLISTDRANRPLR